MFFYIAFLQRTFIASVGYRTDILRQKNYLRICKFALPSSVQSWKGVRWAYIPEIPFLKSPAARVRIQSARSLCQHGLR